MRCMQKTKSCMYQEQRRDSMFTVHPSPDDMHVSGPSTVAQAEGLCVELKDTECTSSLSKIFLGKIKFDGSAFAIFRHQVQAKRIYHRSNPDFSVRRIKREPNAPKP